MPTEAQPKSSFAVFLQKAKDFALYVPHLIGKEIWRTEKVADKSLRGTGFALLRVIMIAWEGILRNRVPSQAGALSYYTLIAIAPLLAIAIMISGFVLKGENSEDVIVDAITELIFYIAPPAEEAANIGVESLFHTQDSTSAGTGAGIGGHIDVDALAKAAAEPTSTEEAKVKAAVDPKIVQFLQDLVRNARSGSLGVVGSLMLIWISVQLLSTIEKTFNTIWGVRQARSLLQRLVFYWTLISLGAVLGFTAVSLGVYGQIARQFEHIPFGHLFRDSFLWLAPLWTFISTVVLIAIFYRFIPNTHVRWKPAFLGALLVTIMLLLNKELSFIYVGFVIRQGSLLGVVGILPIFLFGLWLFWVILLLGGQLTFAMQNVNNLTNQRAWENVSLRTRETLGLAALLLTARRFEACEKPYTADEMADRIRVPGNILNECLGLLVDVGFLSPVEDDSNRRQKAVRYQPARPLEKISLAEYKAKLETRGNNQGTDLIKDADPILQQYEENLLDYQSSDYAARSLHELFAAKASDQQPQQ